ncbi:SDR family oxidoreductase [Albibacterium indicum]|uniref:SDR family oxidoreductase n=1 Tax=Albibacterium indicum TaxID=2292082 RepID=UPI000E479918|nr:SDR family oxidoreductase [Pedobacter indicus]
MKIGITGATGQLGRLVVEKLKQKIDTGDLVALVRSPEKAADLGIEAREFDYTKPEKLVNSLEGVDKLMMISGSEVGQRKTQHENVISAAKKAGIKSIVYTSLLKADSSTLSLAGEHVQTEQMLKTSGIPHTILRNGWYTENYLMSIKEALASGALLGSAGDGKISSATREDFAEAAAVVLTSDNQAGEVYELAGDESYTLRDLAVEVSRQSGNDFPYKNLPESEYVEVLKSIGVPESFAPVIAGWDVSASKGDLFDDSKTLSSLIGRPTTPLTTAVKEALK